MNDPENTSPVSAPDSPAIALPALEVRPVENAFGDVGDWLEENRAPVLITSVCITLYCVLSIVATVIFSAPPVVPRPISQAPAIPDLSDATKITPVVLIIPGLAIIGFAMS